MVLPWVLRLGQSLARRDMRSIAKAELPLLETESAGCRLRPLDPPQTDVKAGAARDAAGSREVSMRRREFVVNLGLLLPAPGRSWRRRSRPNEEAQWPIPQNRRQNASAPRRSTSPTKTAGPRAACRCS